MTTDFVLNALGQVLYARQPKHAGGLIHHSDRESQYLPVRYKARLAEACVDTSVGSRDDSYDTAFAETINGLYKAQVVDPRARWKSRQSMQLAMPARGAWINEHRLMEWLGHISAAEAGANYYRRTERFVPEAA